MFEVLVAFAALLLTVIGLAVFIAVAGSRREARLLELLAQVVQATAIGGALERPQPQVPRAVPGRPQMSPVEEDREEWEQEVREMQEQAASFVPPVDRRKMLLEQAQRLQEAQELLVRERIARERGIPADPAEEPIT